MSNSSQDVVGVSQILRSLANLNVDLSLSKSVWMFTAARTFGPRMDMTP